MRALAPALVLSLAKVSAHAATPIPAPVTGIGDSRPQFLTAENIAANICR